MLSGAVPMIGTPAAFKPGSEIERRLTAELHDHALRHFLFVNVEDVLVGERLEVEFVARVVIGRDGFRIRVDHDRFDPELAQGEGGVDAAIVEFDSLADAVWSAAEDHDFAFRARADLVLAPVGGVIVGRVGFEFRGAGIDQPVGRDDAGGFAPCADFFFGRA